MLTATHGAGTGEIPITRRGDRGLAGLCGSTQGCAAGGQQGQDVNASGRTPECLSLPKPDRNGALDARGMRGLGGSSHPSRLIPSGPWVSEPRLETCGPDPLMLGTQRAAETGSGRGWGNGTSDCPTGVRAPVGMLTVSGTRQVVPAQGTHYSPPHRVLRHGSFYGNFTFKMFFQSCCLSFTRGLPAGVHLRA